MWSSNAYNSPKSYQQDYIETAYPRKEMRSTRVSTGMGWNIYYHRSCASCLPLGTGERLFQHIST
ncbi:hypothetical protein AVEN_157599-1, partial [Araneus ventricosus]